MPTFKGDGDSIVLNQTGVSLQASFTVSSLVSGSTLNGVSWTFSTDRNDYYVWYNVTDAAAGVQDPALDGVGIPVSLTTAEAALGASIMAATLVQLSKLSEIGVTQTASNEVSITVKEFGAVTSPVAGASPFAVTEDVVGVARKDVNAKFLDLDANGSVVQIVGGVGSASTFEVSASTTVHTIEELNLFRGSVLTLGLGSDLTTITKSDNRPSKGVS